MMPSVGGDSITACGWVTDPRVQRANTAVMPSQAKPMQEATEQNGCGSRGTARDMV